MVYLCISLSLYIYICVHMCLEDPLIHKFVPNPCFDTLFAPSSTFSEASAFWNARKRYERNFCATRAQFPQLERNFPQPSAISKSVLFAFFSVRALFKQPGGNFSLHKFVYQLVLQVVTRLCGTHNSRPGTGEDPPSAAVPVNFEVLPGAGCRGQGQMADYEGTIK